MSTDTGETVLHRCDPARNMFRFYSVAIEPDLFGQFLAVRRWGRIGTSGRSLATACRSLQDAVDVIEHHALCKRRRGYVDRPAK